MEAQQARVSLPTRTWIYQDWIKEQVSRSGSAGCADRMSSAWHSSLLVAFQQAQGLAVCHKAIQLPTTC